MIPLVFLMFNLTFIAMEVCLHPSLLVCLSVCRMKSRFYEISLVSLQKIMDTLNSKYVTFNCLWKSLDILGSRLVWVLAVG